MAKDVLLIGVEKAGSHIELCSKTKKACKKRLIFVKVGLSSCRQFISVDYELCAYTGLL